MESKKMELESMSEMEAKMEREHKEREAEMWKMKKCHEKLDHYMRKHWFEYTVIFLIIADALIVVATLLIEIRIEQEQVSEELMTAEAPPGGAENTEAPAATGHSAEPSGSILELETAAQALQFSSLAILTFFMVEVFLKLYAQREKFFKRKLQIVDGFIVAISFAFDIAEVAIKKSDTPEILSGLSLLIILRLWRLIRIVNSAVVATKERLTERIHAVKRLLMVSHEANIELKMKLDQKEEEVNFLKSRLSKYEPVDMIPNGSTRLPAYLPETNAFPAQVLGDLASETDYNMTDMSAVGITLGNHGQTSAFQANRDLDMASDSDVMSLPPPKSRSGNTFTVKKDGVPMTSL